MHQNRFQVWTIYVDFRRRCCSLRPLKRKKPVLLNKIERGPSKRRKFGEPGSGLRPGAWLQSRHGTATRCTAG